MNKTDRTPTGTRNEEREGRGHEKRTWGFGVPRGCAATWGSCSRSPAWKGRLRRARRRRRRRPLRRARPPTPGTSLPSPSFLLLFPLPKNRGNRARRTEARDGIREEEEEESFLWLPLSPPFPLPFLSPLLPPSLLPVGFFGGVLIPETREERDWGAGIEYSLSCLFSPSSLNFCCPSRVVCLALAWR